MKVGLNTDSTTEDLIFNKHASGEFFKKAQGEMYNSRKSSNKILTRTETGHASLAEIQNLKEVLHNSNLKNNSTRRYGTQAHTSKKD